jgi:hypothetical protein
LSFLWFAAFAVNTVQVVHLYCGREERYISIELCYNGVGRSNHSVELSMDRTSLPLPRTLVLTTLGSTAGRTPILAIDSRREDKKKVGELRGDNGPIG